MATRTIGTELVLTGEKSFNDGMKAVNANLKNLRSDMAATTAEFADNADSMEALTAKQKILGESVAQHQAKVDALREMYEKVKKESGENSAAADKYRQQLNAATVALHKETQALKKNQDALDAAQKAKTKYIPLTQRMSGAVKDAKDKVLDFGERVKDAAHHMPVLGEAMDIASVSAKGMGKAVQAAGTGTKKALSGVGSAAASMGKLVGGAAAAASAGVVAIGAAAGAALLGMANMAKEAAEAAKASSEAGEDLTADQQRWLEFSGQLDRLQGSATNAKSAIAGILLPVLGDLATEGTDFLNSFTADMSAAAGDTEKQTEILGQYIADGAKLIIQKLPDYIKAGKDILGGVLGGFQESAPELLDMGLDLIMDLLHYIMSEAPTLADAGIELVLQLIEGLDGEDLAESAAQMIERLVSGLADAAPKLIQMAARLVMELAFGLAKSAPQLLESGWDLITGIVDGIILGFGEIAAMGPGIINTLIDGLRNSDSKVLQWCGDLIDTIIGGIADAWEGLVTWFNGLWDNLFSGRDVDVNVNASGSAAIDGSHASGLRYVPFDGYLAQLHRGEAVLTAEEAAAYRSGNTDGKVFNLTINPKSVSKEDLDMLVEYMNGKLGDGL